MVFVAGPHLNFWSVLVLLAGGWGWSLCGNVMSQKSLAIYQPRPEVVFAYTASYGGVADVIEYYTSIPSSGFDGRKVAGAAAENDSLQLYSGV